jgi:NADH-quinone oxidoreductase subunit L
MMLGIGVAGWAAGLFHLITHAFFKSLMFLASGSVIAGCHHEQEMPRMGGLRRKMPITAYTMLVGVIAISGLAVPGVIAFSGYHSKDAIVATALAHNELNSHFLLFFVPLITAGITAFYMFRLWFLTFAGEPRDQKLHDHVHESPAVMTGPLVVLSVLAAFCAVGGEDGILYKLLSDSEPAGVAAGVVHQAGTVALTLPSHDQIKEVHSKAGWAALLAAILGAATAYVVYGKRLVDPADAKRQFAGLHTFLIEKWWFDELYDTAFVRPARVVSGWCAAFDRVVIDGLLHRVSKVTVDLSRLDRRFDEGIIDGFVNLTADVLYAFGRSLRVFQTGLLRQYVMFIAVGVLGLFLLLFTFFPK